MSKRSQAERSAHRTLQIDYTRRQAARDNRYIDDLETSVKQPELAADVYRRRIAEECAGDTKSQLYRDLERALANTERDRP